MLYASSLFIYVNTYEICVFYKLYVEIAKLQKISKKMVKMQLGKCIKSSFNISVKYMNFTFNVAKFI